MCVSFELAFELKTVVCFSRDESLISQDLSLTLQDEILISRGGNLIFSSTAIPSLCLVLCTVILDFSCTGNFFANNQPNSVALKNTRLSLIGLQKSLFKYTILIMMNK